MSHITTVKTEFKDLEAVKSLCQESRWRFKENQTTYHCWEHDNPGYSKGQGITLAKDWDKCTHAIAFDNCKWEVGLVKTDTGYRVVGDDLLFNDYHWSNGQGQGSEVGVKFGLFTQGYAKHKLLHEAKRRGQSVRQEKLKNGHIQLRIMA